MMQLGITIPMERYLTGIKSLPRQALIPERGRVSGHTALAGGGTPGEDLVFCWELHVITWQGRKALIAVNAGNCFTVLLWNMTGLHWRQYPELVQEGIRRGFLEAGYTSEQAAAYFDMAGETVITKTHGRRPVAALNRMVEFLWRIPAQPDAKQLYQPFLSRALNQEVLKAPGFGVYGSPEEFLEADLKKLKII